ncbi:MAG: hypothetical protein HC801_13985 [Nitrospira sp.]|nr:hypothetical protein [Nitrospira sp.]
MWTPCWPHCCRTRATKAWVSRNRSSWHSVDSRRFFTVAGRALQLGNLIREGDELIGQAIEEAEVLDVLLDPIGVSRGNAFGALLTFEGALKNEVGTRLDDLAIAAGFEELATEGAAPQVVDLFHAFKNGVALGAESLDWIRHAAIVSIAIQ